MTEVLHLKHLHAVLGLSIGGEQTFVWAVLYPEFFDLAVPILGTPRLTSYDLIVKQIMPSRSRVIRPTRGTTRRSRR